MEHQKTEKERTPPKDEEKINPRQGQGEGATRLRRQWPPVCSNVTITAASCILACILALHLGLAGAWHEEKEKMPQSGPQGGFPHQRGNSFNGYCIDATHLAMASFAPAADCKLNHGDETHRHSPALCQVGSKAASRPIPHLACPPPTPMVNTTKTCNNSHQRYATSSHVSEQLTAGASAVSCAVRIQTCGGAQGVCTLFTADGPRPSSSAMVGRKKKNMRATLTHEKLGRGESLHTCGDVESNPGPQLTGDHTTDQPMTTCLGVDLSAQGIQGPLTTLHPLRLMEMQGLRSV